MEYFGKTGYNKNQNQNDIAKEEGTSLPADMKTATSRPGVEKATLQQMDKQYAPWRKRLRKALGWKGQIFGIFIPESLDELTEESEILHNCAESLKQAVAQKKKGVLFLRKLTLPDAPYYTVVVIKGSNGKYRVEQCRGFLDSDPITGIDKILKQWATDTGKVDEDSIKSEY